MRSLNEHLADNNNPFAIAKIESSLSIRQSIDCGIQLITMGEKFGFEETLKLLTRLIENTAGFFNVNNNLSANQLVQIAQSIVERFGHDNIEDIILALKDARMGMCEKVYGRIDGEIIIGWIERYMEKKAEELEKNHHQNKLKNLEISPEITALALKIANKADETKTLKPLATSAENWLQWFEEFKTSLNVKDLKAIKFDLETNNILRNGFYEKTIEWINERINHGVTA